MVIEFTKRYKTTREEEALWWMSYDCRLCGIGKWYCQCEPNSFLDVNSDGEHVTDDEEEWEPDLGWLEEDEKQNEGLQTPNKGERSTLQSVSPENATVNERAAGRRLAVWSQEEVIALPTSSCISFY